VEIVEFIDEKNVNALLIQSSSNFLQIRAVPVPGIQVKHIELWVIVFDVMIPKAQLINVESPQSIQ
jgi:hypothetical protein